MKKLFLVVFAALSFSITAFSQEKLVKEEGWEFPKVSSFEMTSRTKRAVDGFWVNVSEFDLKKSDEKPSIFLRSAQESTGKSDDFCEARKASYFSAGDKIFAYSFQCVLFSIFEKEQENVTLRSKRYMGAMTEFYYFDEDGDGKFEARYSAWDMKVKLPDWAKNQD